MQQRICTIGFDTHANDITNLAINSDEALYDFDVIIVRPNFGSLSSKATPLGSGDRILLAPESENLVDRVIHWHEQLDQALAGGKTVFVLCDKPEDLGVSHTSRKIRTMSEVQPDQIINSYDLLPDRPEFTPVKGKRIKLQTNRESFAEYWKELEPHSAYTGRLEDESAESLFKTATGEHSVGMILPTQSPGNLVFLPDIPAIGRLTAMEEPLSIADLFRAVDTELRQAEGDTPPPDWVGEENYQLSTAVAAQRETAKLNKEKGSLDRQISRQLEISDRAETLKALLFGKSNQLEIAVIKALGILGFSANGLEDGNRRFDVVFESPEGQFLGEAEGRDRKPIAVHKFRQLTDNMNSYMEMDDQIKEPKGVLFGNGNRLTAPEKRTSGFTQMAQERASNRSAALINTHELFSAIRYLDANDDPDYAMTVRKAMLAGRGETHLPPPPEGN